MRELSLADEEGEATLGCDQARGDREGVLEAFDCAEGYYFGGRVLIVFGAAGEYIDVHQCKCSGDLAQEGCFLLVGLDQGQLDVGRPDFDGETGEAGA